MVTYCRLPMERNLSILRSSGSVAVLPARRRNSMPMMQGKSQKAKSTNIAHLIKKGYPQKKAIAIAFSEAGESRKSDKKPKK